MTLGPQFNIDYPYPRLREAYAKHWSKNYAQMLQGEGEVVSPEELHEDGMDQAKMLMENALYGDDYSKKLLYKGFQNRH